MQQDKRPQTPYKIPKSLFKHPHQFLRDDEIWTDAELWSTSEGNAADVAERPTVTLPFTSETLTYEQLDERLEGGLGLSSMSTMHLMQLSGMMQAIQTPKPVMPDPAAGPTVKLTGPRQTGSFPAASYFNNDIYGKTMLLKVPTTALPAATPQPAWKKALGNSKVRVALGAIVGIAMLLLVFRSINIPKTIAILQSSLTTPQGIMFACLAALACLTSYAIRGVRWSLFLSNIGKVSVFKAIQIFYTAVFINFALPVQGGEVAKSLMLKRLTGIPVSQSLPTVAMDKALDLLPALVIMAIVPLMGISMSATLWIILGTVGGILLGLIFVVALTAWNRATATKLIQLGLGILPKGIGGKIEGFAMGLVDSLLAGASKPKTFIPAILLTCLAVSCDGLFALFSFWTTGLSNMTFGAALFGYTTFNMFTILPAPPGGVGSNELYGGIVFGDLLGFNKDHVTAMFLFSHPLFAILMTVTALICLRTLGLTINTIMKGSGNDKGSAEQKDAYENSKSEKQAVSA